MTDYEILAFTFSALAIVVIPMFALLIRIVIKWTKLESKMTEVVDDVRKVVEDKEHVHTAMYEQMKEDRKATDRRLRWLEEYLWKHGRPTERN